MKVQKRVLNTEHLDTLMSMHDLVTFYHLQGHCQRVVLLGEHTV